MEPEADFQKANCHSEQYGTCLVSSSPVRWVYSGEEAGTRGEDHIMAGTRMGGELKVKLFEMRLKCIEMKIGPALTAAIGIHSEMHSIGFDQIEWVNRRGSSESTQTMMLLPQWRTKDPDPQEFCRQSSQLQPLPHIPAEKNTRAPILHLYYFSIFQTVGVPSAAAQTPPPLSSSAPITKLSAQIREAASLTAAKHLYIHKHTNCAVQAKQYILPHQRTCTSPDCFTL